MIGYGVGLRLQRFDFTISHSPSKQNPSDALSRLPKLTDKLIDTLPSNAEVNAPSSEPKQVAQVSSTLQSTGDGYKPSLHTPTIKYSSDKMKTAQASDSTITTVKSWITAQNTPKTAGGLSPDLKTYRSSINRLKIENDVLFRSWERNTCENPQWLVCVPENLQEEIINMCHSPPTSGHLGDVKTLQRIRTAFYFPKMELKTKLHVAACHVCIKRRRPHKNNKAPITPFAGMYPGELVFMDIMEALPVTNGYQSILIIIDSFTKWSECIPLRSTKVEYIARALLNTWVSRQGVMEQLHSDRGANVDSARILQALYKMLGIHKTANIAYRPQTDGAAERMVGTLKGMLWKYCQSNPHNWVNCLDQVLFAYRTSVHSTTGFSPFFMDKGRLPRLPMHILMGVSPQTLMGEYYSETAHALYSKLRQAYATAREHLKSKQISAKKNHDVDISVQNFIAGEWAYIWKPAPKDCNYRKFYDHWRGPFKVIERVTSHSYKIKLAENKYDIVHMELMKTAPPPSPVNESIRNQTDTPALNPDQPRVENESDGDSDIVGVKLPATLTAPEPTNRYPQRTRTARIPYQHAP